MSFLTTSLDSARVCSLFCFICTLNVHKWSFECTPVLQWKYKNHKFQLQIPTGSTSSYAMYKCMYCDMNSLWRSFMFLSEIWKIEIWKIKTRIERKFIHEDWCGNNNNNKCRSNIRVVLQNPCGCFRRGQLTQHHALCGESLLLGVCAQQLHPSIFPN